MLAKDLCRPRDNQLEGGVGAREGWGSVGPEWHLGSSPCPVHSDSLQRSLFKYTEETALCWISDNSEWLSITAIFWWFFFPVRVNPASRNTAFYLVSCATALLYYDSCEMCRRQNSAVQKRQSITGSQELNIFRICILPHEI